MRTADLARTSIAATLKRFLRASHSRTSPDSNARPKGSASAQTNGLFQTEIPKVRNRSPGSSSLLPSKRSDQTSVTRLGEFRKFLETNFGSKVAQMYSNFLGYFKEHPFQGKLLLLLFGQLLETFGLPFISTSDRTGFDLPMSRCYKQSTIVIYKSSHYLVRVA